MVLDILFVMLYPRLRFYVQVQHESTADAIWTPFFLWKKDREKEGRALD